MLLASLESHCAFSKLQTHELERLNVVSKPFSLQRDNILNRKGNPTDGLYFITRGYAKIVWPEKNEKETLIKIVAPGDMTGYRCLFSESVFRATAVCLTNPTEGIFVPKDFFHHLLADNSAFNSEILKLMGKEIRRSEDRLRSFCSKNVRERLAEALLELYEISGHHLADQNKTLLEIDLTRLELASWIGTAKETLVRCLSDMREENVIDQTGNYIAITNLEAIKKIANI